jgi:hypothetical protein
MPFQPERVDIDGDWDWEPATVPEAKTRPPAAPTSPRCNAAPQAPSQPRPLTPPTWHPKGDPLAARTAIPPYHVRQVNNPLKEQWIVVDSKEYKVSRTFATEYEAQEWILTR